jgi:hypothetical protein
MIESVIVPRLVHLASEKVARRIERSGLRGNACWVNVDGVRHDVPEAVYAMPVVADISITYQWLRELRRRGHGKLVAVHFAVPGEERVYVGRYGPDKKVGPARKMIRVLLQQPLGAEVLVPRRIPIREHLKTPPKRHACFSAYPPTSCWSNRSSTTFDSMHSCRRPAPLNLRLGRKPNSSWIANFMTSLGPSAALRPARTRGVNVARFHSAYSVGSITSKASRSAPVHSRIDAP